MDGLRIRYFIAGPFDVMTYLLMDPKSGDAMLIDPAGRCQEVQSELVAENGNLKYIVATHGHVDHILALKEFKEAFGAPLVMHPLDHQMLTEGYDSLFGDLGEFRDIALEKPVQDGDILRLGEIDLKVLHTPGHTPGSICLLTEENIFTGDTLFVGAVGRTDLKGGSFETLLESIRSKLLPLPDHIIVWPGHDYGDTPTSTIGRERAENPYITDFLT